MSGPEKPHVSCASGVCALSVSASQIDVHVGQRMRRRREDLGFSQSRLGRHLGLTFSQIQKYEKGTNRIGAGRLYQIASFLGVAPSHFFEGLEGGSPPAAETARGQGSASLDEEIGALTQAFKTIPAAETRASVIALVRSLTSQALPDRRPVRE